MDNSPGGENNFMFYMQQRWLFSDYDKSLFD